MKLKLDESIVTDAAGVVEFLKHSQGIDAHVSTKYPDDGFIVYEGDEGAWSQSEIFETGADFGRAKEREKWTEPEVMYLSTESANLLKQAVQSYSADAMVRVDSVDIGEPEGSNVKVTIRPTSARHLMSIARDWGALMATYTKTTVTQR